MFVLDPEIAVVGVILKAVPPEAGFVKLQLYERSAAIVIPVP